MESNKVLLVDDEEGNFDSLMMVMKKEANFPIEFFTAKNEEEALNLIDQENFDVIVTDLVMNTENGGLEVIKAARKKDPWAMVILLTAYEGQVVDRYKVFELGAFDVVPKNATRVNPGREILIKVKSAIEFRKLAKTQIENEKIKVSMGRYFDPNIFKIIQQNPNLLNPRNQIVSIVFWDIRGFSLLSESLKAYPELITGFLEEYFDLMADRIFKFNGVLDKFIGDGVMAIFGATDLEPTEELINTNATLALKSSLEIRPRFDALVEKWQDKWGLYTAQRVEIGLGCGIHTGEALVGKFGTTVRDQFTALGPNVNLAARLCGAADKGKIVTSTGTKLRCNKDFIFVDAGTTSNIKNIPGDYPIYYLESLKLIEHSI